MKRPTKRELEAEVMARIHHAARNPGEEIVPGMAFKAVGRRHSRDGVVELVRRSPLLIDGLPMTVRFRRERRKTFAERMVEIRQVCADILRKQNPDPKIRDQIDNIAAGILCRCKEFLSWQTTLKYDSTEGLAARVLFADIYMRTHDEAVEHNLPPLIDPMGFAFDIGEMWTLLRVYRAESSAATPGGKVRAQKRWAGRGEVTAMIQRIATSLVYDEWPTAEKWDAFIGLLNDENLNPKEHGQLKDEHVKDEHNVVFNGGSMTYKTFRNRISEARKPSR